MCGCVHETKGLKPRGFSALVTTLALSILLAGHLWAQSPSTGALIGRTLDPSGAAIPGVKIQIIGRDTDVTLSATSDEQGRFGFQLLAPGNYGLQAVKASFDPLQLDDINISVTEPFELSSIFTSQPSRSMSKCPLNCRWFRPRIRLWAAWSMEPR